MNLPWPLLPSACVCLLALWLVIAVAGLLRPSSVRFAGRQMFVAGSLVGLALAVVAALALFDGHVGVLTLVIGLPDLPFHLRLDPLSATFLLLLGLASAGVSVFAAGYFREGEGASPGLLCLQYHLFLASMGFVLLADDAYAFMVAWESMALSSYFLVTTQHQIPEIRSAGFLYLLMAHLGAIALLLCFGVLQGGSWHFTFDAMRQAHLSPGPAALAFLLALVGFGAKAGLVPLHVWLPEAHPAAPSPVSALMSGVMLKTAVYGMLRVSFDLLGEPTWWWGLVPLSVGLITALYGLVFAAVQTDMKRLLAYSSIENLGLAFTGLGLAIVFLGVGMRGVAGLALLATLYHCLNHALMKSLLFLGTGAVLHATHERNLGRLGGLIHRMPWVAWLSLVGALAIAGLPPLNGFVSEWLLLQAFLFADLVPHSFVNMLIPMGAALVALCAALAGYVMVKFFGVIFLGQPREASLAHAQDAGPLERIGLAWLALGCVLLGLLPAQMLTLLRSVTEQLIGVAVTRPGTPWWLLAPVPGRQVSYSPLVLFGATVLVIALTAYAVRHFYHRRVRRGPAWDCGFGALNARMQDTAEGFGQPIRNIFQGFFSIDRELPGPFDRMPRYRIFIRDRIWDVLYEPVGGLVQRCADVVALLQQGRIAAYLLYSFLTLVALLAVVLVL
jgi:formate hydrogenlyase subunit 3/multisubunit Na+/H+ antiporter MnhD subunit